MIAKIHTLSPTGGSVVFETESMKLEALLEALPLIETRLEEAGYEVIASAPPAPPMTVTVTNSQQNTFAARELVAEVLDKKPYWKIVGAPPFHKFGMRVWPETLEAAGIEVEKLDLLKGLDLTGYTARWEHRNNGKGGQMQTVVELHR